MFNSVVLGSEWHFFFQTVCTVECELREVSGTVHLRRFHVYNVDPASLFQLQRSSSTPLNPFTSVVLL